MADISKITPLGSSTTYDITARALNYSPQITTLEDLNAFGKNEIKFKVAKISALDGHTGTLTKNDGMILAFPWSGGYGHQFYVDDNGYGLHHRYWYTHKVNDVDTVDFNNWVQILDSNNYTNYTVKKDGTGATGTWGISITGNAATATKATQDASGNVITSTYVKKAGDTMTGLLTLTSGATHKGVKIGDTYINAIDGNLILQNNGAIRFGTDAWDYNQWAGLKYVHSSKTISLGLADNSVFTANAAQTGGTFHFINIDKVRLTNNTGGIYKLYSAASTAPFLQVNSNNFDVSILKIDGDNPTDIRDSQSYGFNLKYIGTGGGAGNTLRLYGDNSGGTDQLAMEWSGDGRVGIGTTYSSSYRLNVNGASYFNGNTTHNGTDYFANGTTYYINNSGSANLLDITGRSLGISQTNGTGCGISLYSGAKGTAVPEYGLAFMTTGNGGKYGDVQSDWATYFTMNGANQRGWIWKQYNQTGTGYMAGALSTRGVATFKGLTADSQFVVFPKGGLYATNTATITGALKITLPQFKTSTMMTFDVTIYTYEGANKNTVIYHIGGYEYGDSGWYNSSSRVYSEGIGNRINLTVRFGYDGSKACVTIGEVNTTWNYPQVAISNILCGYSNYSVDKWGQDWSVSFVTTLPGTISGTFNNVNTQDISITGNASSASKLTNARTISLTGSVTGSGSFDGSGNLSIATTTNHTHSSASLTNIAFTWSGSYSDGDWMLIHNGETGSGGGQLFRAINKANTAAWVDGAHKWVRLAGDTMTGTIKFSDNNIGIQRVGRSASWIKGRDSALVRTTSISGYSPAISIKTNNGSWEIGAYDNSSYTDDLIYTYCTDSNYNANNNNTTAQIKFLENGHIVGALDGNASSATKLANARTISLTGSVTGSGSFDGSGNISIATTTNHTHSDYIPKSIGTTKGDILYWSAASTPARLAVGANGKVLKVVSGVPAWGDISIPYGDTLPSTGTNGDVFLQTSAEYYELPAGGAAGRILMKKTAGDRDVQWTTNVYVSNDVLFGAAWNDYAEYREPLQNENPKPGNCVIETGEDSLQLSTARMQPGAEIVSDTFGFAIGKTEKANLPIAVSGRVLAYTYEDREEFRKNIGRPVCSGPNGTVSIMTDEEYRNYGYCAIGTISSVPNYETWGENNIKVDNRVWIKVR